VIARHLLISGKVQGVYYRGWSEETALALGLTGWVRNRMNGDVELVVQGKADVIEHFIAMAHRGPSAARVTVVEASEVPVSFIQGFEQRASA
jgi:acylphosphatase